MNKQNKDLILYANIDTDVAVRSAVALFERNNDVQGGADEYDEIGGVGKPNAQTSRAENGCTISPRTHWTTIQKAMLAGIGSETVKATYWQNHICTLMSSSDNPFSRAAEHGAYASLEKITKNSDIIHALEEIPESDAGLFKLAAAELETIMNLYAYDFNAAPGIAAGVGNIASLSPSPKDESRRERVHEALCTSGQNSGLIAATKLAAYHRSFGAGALESADCFFWNGGFTPVTTTDPIKLSDLIGVDRQTAALTENIEFLLCGLTASNILLYGDSGTGKSSSVKALLNEYKDRGLKLVALPKGRIGELPGVLSAAAGRGLKFVIYVDDLSFEENESTYKSFKSVIEGGVSARPQNAILCVTSNRRNIVKEVWKDRESSDDVNIRDNLQEKRSLADRFGLTLVYGAPDKEEFLAIVAGLAQKSGIRMEESALRASALTWAVRHGGRSGRTAKQFIDYTAGRMALGGTAKEEQEGDK